MYNPRSSCSHALCSCQYTPYGLPLELVPLFLADIRVYWRCSSNSWGLPCIFRCTLTVSSLQVPGGSAVLLPTSCSPEGSMSLKYYILPFYMPAKPGTLGDTRVGLQLKKQSGLSDFDCCGFCMAGESIHYVPWC